MSFQKKYYYTFKSIKDVQYTVEIWQDTINSITAEEIISDASPFKVNYPKVDNKFTTIRGSGCDLNLLSTSNMKYINLYTADVQAYKIKFYEGDNLIWIGYLDSELYSEPFAEFNNYPVSLTGNDGLSILERFEFLDEDGVRISGIKSNWELITFVLGKLNLEWNNIYVGLSTTSPDIPFVDNKTIFTETYSNCDNYYDEDGKAMTCREVLETILAPFGAYIQIINANVYITDINALAQEAGEFKSYYTFSIKYADNSADACNGTSYTVYSRLPVPRAGDTLYTDQELTQPFNLGSSVLFLNPSIYNDQIVNVNNGVFTSLSGYYCVYSSTSYIKFNSNSSGSLSVVNPNSRTFTINFSYYLESNCDAIGVNDPNQATTTLYITTDGINYTMVDYVSSSVPAGPPEDRSDGQSKNGTYQITNITDVNNVAFSASIDYSTDRLGKGGMVQITIDSVSADSGNVTVDCSDKITFYPTNTYLDCTPSITTTTTTPYSPSITNTSYFRKYDNQFNYISYVQINCSLGDVSIHKFATSDQTLNILSPINKQKVTWSPYINSSVLNYKTSEDHFTGLTSTSYYGVYPYSWTERLYSKSNYWNTIVSDAYFAQSEASNKDKDQYLVIKNQGIFDELYRFEYSGNTPLLKLPLIIGSEDYLLKVEAKLFARTKANIDDGEESQVFIKKLQLKTELSIGGEYYSSASNSYTNTTSYFIWEVSSSNKNSDGNFEYENISDKWMDLKKTRSYLSETLTTLYIPINGFTGNEMKFYINGFKAFDKNNNNITSQVLEVRIKDIKFTLCYKNTNEIENEGVDYKSYVNKKVRDDGEDVTLKLGTNFSFNPLAKGSLLGKNNDEYYFIQDFSRSGKTEIVENLLSRSIISNYTNKTIEITCTINRIPTIFGTLTYNNYWSNMRFGIQEAIIDYDEEAIQLVLQEIQPDNMDIKKNY